MKKLIEKYKNLKDNKKVLALFGILSAVLITLSASYAFFSYVKLGLTNNTLQTGSIKFIYQESNRVGNGIFLEDAMPMSNEVGKVQDKYFDFSVTGTSGNAKIDYEITARKTATSDDISDYVKLYLTKVDGGAEEEKVLSIYSNLTASSNQIAAINHEKTLYMDSIPAGSVNYTDNYRLRMWLNDDINEGNILEYTQTETGVCSDPAYTTELDCIGAHKDWTRTATPMTTKTFTVKINVYANGKLVTAQEIANAESTGIMRINVNTNEADLETDTSKDYDYILNTTAKRATIEVLPANENATVKIEPYSPTAMNNIQKLSTSKEVTLNNGDNYYKITVISANRKNREEYILNIKTEIDDVEVEGDSILGILKDNQLSEGNYIFKINNKSEEYRVHLYNYDGNQVWTENMTFGDDKDVATKSDEFAKRMVIVKVNGNLTINEGVTVGPYYTTYGGPKGFTLYVTGTLTNNGTIDNSHGAYAIGEDVYLWKNATGTYETVPAAGATGGEALYIDYDNDNGTASSNGNAGQNGYETPSLRGTGGGGSGAAIRGDGSGWARSGAGGAGTSYSGGTGGGSAHGNDWGLQITASSGGINGGAGGAAYAYNNSGWAARNAGGGAGNPGGKGSYYASPIDSGKGENGTGGLLILYANTFNNSGIIKANGSNGGSNMTVGGSSGGGSVNVFYNTLIAQGSLEATGGITGGIGGDGSVNMGIIENGNYRMTYIYYKKDFKYTGSEQTYNVPMSGKYKIETWGAQGGHYDATYYGGYGGYSTGVLNLNKNSTLYINIGGKGTASGGQAAGGYNGGGACYPAYGTFGSGGGATHIATVSGELKELSQYQNTGGTNVSNEILIVSGGGGGSIAYYDTGNWYGYGSGGSGGGYIGAAGIQGDHWFGGNPYCGLAAGGNQTSAGLSSSICTGVGCGVTTNASFGLGASWSDASTGGGAGWYGAGYGYFTPASGGSGYIGSSKLVSSNGITKHMYCFNCSTSTDTNTYTISNGTSSCHNSTPTSDCAKEGHGYARITYLGE